MLGPALYLYIFFVYFVASPFVSVLDDEMMCQMATLAVSYTIHDFVWEVNAPYVRLYTAPSSTYFLLRIHLPARVGLA